MKKIFLFFVFSIIFVMPAFAESVKKSQINIDESKPLEIGISFDWISKTQLQRDENIKQIQNTLFADNTITKYSKNDFKSKYSEFLKEKDYVNLYDEISQGKKEDAQKYYCGFYVGKLLIAYGIQYKNNLKNIYYYDALGNLRWLDTFSDNYPNFPYLSYQYYRDGRLVAAYYYISEYDQYVFDENKKFKGRWYKENMYNKNAKIIMTRTNY